ncbi:Rieske 2Fe-2S domain-containing protein [Neptunomonas phycophila]|uniref:Rieske 2Fe-2S domain-containing protein n=1 Tax=Neptunomonas phycophila TaxID=1572645 RepID=A0AAW7XEW0_9GAMM|nr:Rieske 2Fe-2S domain-containing protein [Neptunomonas phycophila]MDO6452818.1 Rieske 2Fe-2S domain-containing protein [Neptunomonas phycophila]
MNEEADQLRLCHIDDIAEGEAKGFLVNDDGNDTFFIVKSEGKLFGWFNSCPHIDGAPMAWRKDAYLNAKRSHIACHAHGALFEPKTGLCIQGPCVGKTLESVTIKVNLDGHAWVLLSDIRKNKN